MHTIIVCPHTKKEVIADITNDMNYICRHNDDPEQDQRDVDQLRVQSKERK